MRARCQPDRHLAGLPATSRFRSSHGSTSVWCQRARWVDSACRPARHNPELAARPRLRPGSIAPYENDGRPRKPSNVAQTPAGGGTTRVRNAPTKARQARLGQSPSFGSARLPSRRRLRRRGLAAAASCAAIGGTAFRSPDPRTNPERAKDDSLAIRLDHIHINGMRKSAPPRTPLRWAADASAIRRAVELAEE